MGPSLVRIAPRRIGELELASGPLGFGCWRFTDASVPAARAVVEAALEHGMTLVDTADVYGLDWGGAGFGANEEILGKVLADAPGLRARMILATKGGIAPPVPYDQSDAYLRSACEASLSRLGVDVIDLYQIHRPDVFTHPADLAATLVDLRDAGKIREVGVSNSTVSQTDTLAHHLPFELATDQPRFSAAHLDAMRDGVLDRCVRTTTVPLAWSPLDGGRLATGDTTGDGAPRSELIAVLDRLAEREGVDRSAIALAFVLAHPAAPVAIVGSQDVDRLAAATTALDVTLERTDLYDIVEASDGVPLP